MLLVGWGHLGLPRTGLGVEQPWVYGLSDGERRLEKFFTGEFKGVRSSKSDSLPMLLLEPLLHRHVEGDWERRESEDDDRKVISSQRIAYVGLCAVVIQKMIQEVSIEETVKVKVKVRQLDGTVVTEVRVTPKKARGRHRVDRRMVKKAVGSTEVWALKIVGRLYYHIGVEPTEQSMIESLSRHGVQPEDLVPPLVEMREVVNPEWSRLNNDSLTSSDLDMQYTLLTDFLLILIADFRSRSLLLHLGSYPPPPGGTSSSSKAALSKPSARARALPNQTKEQDHKSETAVLDQVRFLHRCRIALHGVIALGGGLVISLSAGLSVPVIG
ncbi:hypothetical protein C8J55DRAFT_494464 [Lentinula edodes]|uniref:Uncharacterized protein n=1 Tax=Lentinula lateritia TaxID=40482 RepID=A0A9W8ZNT9_9AGAR|nr:hypothetical protein C8J55DRAFT_494464 [Lentinula edodes]